MQDSACISLHPNEYNQELNCYLFAGKLDRWVGSYNTINDLPKNYVFQVKQDLNIHVFNMITRKNQSSVLTEDVSCKCKCKFDGRKCNSNQKCNISKCWCQCKKNIYVKNVIFGILLHIVVKIVNI